MKPPRKQRVRKMASTATTKAHSPEVATAKEPDTMILFDGSGCGFLSNLKPEIALAYRGCHSMAHEKACLFQKYGNPIHAIESVFYSTMFNIPICDMVGEWLKINITEWLKQAGNADLGQLLGLTGKGRGRQGDPFSRAYKDRTEEVFFFFIAEEIGRERRKYSSDQQVNIPIRPLIRRVRGRLPELPLLVLDERTLAERYQSWGRREQIEKLAEDGHLKTAELLKSAGVKGE